MINKLFPFWEPEKIIDSETKRIYRDVNYQANMDSSRYWEKTGATVFLTVLTAVILGFDYSTARVMFDYMDPTLGGISLGPEILALSVPISGKIPRGSHRAGLEQDRARADDARHSQYHRPAQKHD